MNVLIYFQKKAIGHFGGPSGYLQPFLNFVCSDSGFRLFFLTPDLPLNPAFLDTRPAKEPICNKIYRRVLNFLFRLLGLAEFRKGVLYVKNVCPKRAGSRLSKIDLSSFDAIVFHSCLDMYLIRDSLDSYKGTVFLQSHSPKPPYQELISDADGWQFRMACRLYKKRLEDRDRYAFLRADYLIFPCKEAVAPYEKQWTFFYLHREAFLKKTKFLLTCIENNDKTVSRFDLRSKYNIPKTSVVFAFVGRHCKAKGYDVLKRLGRRYRNRRDIFFVILGKFDKRSILRFDNWIELGFVSDVAAVLCEADYCLNLNRTTYYDLGILEQLQLGKNIILSNNGGNKKVISLFGENVRPFSSCSELINLIDEILDGSKEKRNEDDIKRAFLQQNDIEFFFKEFSEMIRDGVHQLNSMAKLSLYDS